MAIFKVTAVPDFSQLKSEIAKLQSSPVTLGVDTRQANVNIKATTQNLKKLTETFSPDGELVHSVSNYSKRIGEVVTVTKSLDRESGEMAVTSKKVTQNFEAQAKAAQKAAREVQSAEDAYRAYTAQQNKGYTPTAMQRRIEGVTGISGGNTKSAAESAKVFEKAWLNASGKVQDGAQKAAREVKNVGKAAKETSGFADLMGKSFSRIVLQMATWQMLGNAIAGVKRSFVEALDTMKSVDDEMVTIRKVTGATTAELNKIEKQAYDTASAYGVAADDYLQFVSGFSRAGYGEQASALAELAAKTQIVGDTNAETAQQFLLSVDAAYKYQGNIEKLTAVLDGANEIDNRYATSIQKVAEGLGKVAPIAAQAHVGVDELTAAIGTITAVTQRSGTEASTALRALFLNIIGDTKTEIDEGVTWTTGEIAGLRDVIKLYAKDAYDAAQATGSVINPMKAIGGLAQSMKDGVLTEQKLMEMVSDIGGKLRTSQLLALIQNWDMYQSMLGDFADAAGSADKEVENALDSWTRKTEILHNKWTQFVSNLVETDTIKNALDGVIGLVELLDSEGGHLVITVGLLTGAVLLLGHAKKELMASEAVKDIKAASAATKELTAKVIAYAAAKKAAAAGDGEMALHAAELKEDLAGALGKLKVFGIGAAIFAALSLAISLSTEKARAYEKALEDVETAQSALDETKSEYDELINKTGELTDAEKKRLEVLKEMRQEQEKQLEATQKSAWEAWDAAHGSGASVVVSGAEGVGGGLGVGAVKTERMDIVALRNYREELAEIAAQYQDGEMSAGAYYSALEDLNAAREESVETIRAAILAGYEVTDEQRELVDAYDRVQQILGVASDATAKYVSGLVEEAAQSGKTEKELYNLVAAQITASNTKLNFSQQIMALQQLAVQAGYAGNALANTFALAGINESNVKRTAEGLLYTGQYSSYEAAYAEALRRAQQAMLYQFGKLTSTAPSGGGGGSTGDGFSGSGGGSSSGESALRKKAQAAIKALEKERDAELQPIEAQIDALKKQNEEIERGEKLEELKLTVLKKQDALLNARNERTVRQYNAATGQWEWVADPQKVKEAEEAVEDAKKDLRDYERDVELDLAVEELEARREAIKSAYQIKIDAWQDYLDGLSGAVAAEGGYISQSVQQNQDGAEEVAKAWEDAAERRKKALAAISSAVSGAADIPADTKPPVSGAIAGAVSGALAGNRKPDLSAGMASKKANDILQGKADLLPKKTPQKGTISRGAAGNKVSRYDSGGILKGMGGIKATERDEMILPPDITAQMTRLASGGNVQQLFSGMRSVLFNGGIPYGQSMAGATTNNDRHDVTYNTYSMNGVTLSPQDANRSVLSVLQSAAHHMKAYGA
jgi:TP901 family phage tail tape measure protein